MNVIEMLIFWLYH